MTLLAVERDMLVSPSHNLLHRFVCIKQRTELIEIGDCQVGAVVNTSLLGHGVRLIKAEAVLFSLYRSDR